MFWLLSGALASLAIVIHRHFGETALVILGAGVAEILLVGMSWAYISINQRIDLAINGLHAVDQRVESMKGPHRWSHKLLDALTVSLGELRENLDARSKEDAREKAGLRRDLEDLLSECRAEFVLVRECMQTTNRNLQASDAEHRKKIMTFLDQLRNDLYKLGRLLDKQNQAAAAEQDSQQAKQRQNHQDLQQALGTATTEISDRFTDIETLQRESEDRRKQEFNELKAIGAVVSGFQDSLQENMRAQEARHKPVSDELKNLGIAVGEFQDNLRKDLQAQAKGQKPIADSVDSLSRSQQKDFEQLANQHDELTEKISSLLLLKEQIAEWQESQNKATSTATSVDRLNLELRRQIAELRDQLLP